MSFGPTILSAGSNTMGKRGISLCAAVVAALVAGQVSASRPGDKTDTWNNNNHYSGGAEAVVNINFDNLAPGAQLSNQYAALGVTFAPGSGGANGVILPPNGIPESIFTDMRISTVAAESANGVSAP